MTTRLQIGCINKPDRNSPYTPINHVGGVNNGSRWKITQDEAIRTIENGTYSFYVIQGGQQVDVIVAVSANGNKYLKTRADTTNRNNLLTLPECP